MEEPAEELVRAWLSDFVVGLNLCPFARPVIAEEGLRIALCADMDTAQQARAFLSELDLLQRSEEAELATTLLVFTRGLRTFPQYLEFLDQCQQLLEAAGLEGLVQLASFHPQYLFEGEEPGAASHYSNRSPLPVIHLLREDMLSRVLADNADAEQIPARNIATLAALGIPELERRWQDLFGDASAAD